MMLENEMVFQNEVLDPLVDFLYPGHLYSSLFWMRSHCKRKIIFPTEIFHGKTLKVGICILFLYRLCGISFGEKPKQLFSGDSTLLKTVL